MHITATHLHLPASTCLAILSIPRIFTPFLIKLGPKSFRRFLWFMIPWSVTRKMGNAVDAMHNVALRIFEVKKQALKDGNEAIADRDGDGKDIINALSSPPCDRECRQRLSLVLS